MQGQQDGAFPADKKSGQLSGGAVPYADGSAPRLGAALSLMWWSEYEDHAREAG